VQAHFGRKVSSDVFGWVAPAAQGRRFGVATRTRTGKRVWDGLSELKKRAGLPAGQAPGPRESYVFPLTRRDTLAHDRVLLVGDAAGLTPAASHDGLYFAMKSGRMAAEAIVRHQHLPVPAHLAEYDRDFWAAFGPLLSGEEKLASQFFGNDRRREALIELAYDREVARAAALAFLDKQPFQPGLKVGLRLKTKLFGQMLKYAVVNPKRHEVEAIARVLPASENYLDLALRTPTGPLRVPAEPLGLPAPAPQAPPAAAPQTSLEAVIPMPAAPTRLIFPEVLPADTEVPSATAERLD
jgi:hypothetical protein